MASGWSGWKGSSTFAHDAPDAAAAATDHEPGTTSFGRHPNLIEEQIEVATAGEQRPRHRTPSGHLTAAVQPGRTISHDERIDWERQLEEVRSERSEPLSGLEHDPQSILRRRETEEQRLHHQRNTDLTTLGQQIDCDAFLLDGEWMVRMEGQQHLRA